MPAYLGEANFMPMPVEKRIHCLWIWAAKVCVEASRETKLYCQYSLAEYCSRLRLHGLQEIPRLECSMFGTQVMHFGS